MIVIPRVDRTALGISYASTDSDTLMQTCPPELQLLIEQALQQWWLGLSNFQKSELAVRQPSFKISASFQQEPPAETLSPLEQSLQV